MNHLGKAKMTFPRTAFGQCCGIPRAFYLGLVSFYSEYKRSLFLKFLFLSVEM